MQNLKQILNQQLILEASRKNLPANIGSVFASSKSASDSFSKHFNIPNKKEVYRLEGKVIVSQLTRPTSEADFESQYTIYIKNPGGTRILDTTPLKLYFYSKTSNFGSNKKSFIMMRNRNSYYSSGDAIVVNDVDFDKVADANISKLSFNQRIIPLDFNANADLPLYHNRVALYNEINPQNKLAYELSKLTGHINQPLGGVYYYIEDIVREFQQK